jgi:hypothetical protein
MDQYNLLALRLEKDLNELHCQSAYSLGLLEY